MASIVFTIFGSALSSLGLSFNVMILELFQFLQRTSMPKLGLQTCPSKSNAATELAKTSNQ